MKRILLVLTVALVMAAIVVATSAPALAGCNASKGSGPSGSKGQCAKASLGGG